MKAAAFAYAKPQTLAEAFDLLERYGDEAKLLAGGQSLVPALNMRLSTPRVLIDLNGLRELDGIDDSDGTIAIRALTRHRTVERSRVVAGSLPLVHQAMPHVAHAAIRNRGTFGGSIALADPAAELPACCVALNAQFVIASRNRQRKVAAREFFRSLYETELLSTEVLLAGEFTVSPPGYRSAFQELSRRHGDYALVGLAAHAKVDGNTFSDVRLLFCGIGSVPVPANHAAATLQQAEFSDAALASAQDALEQDIAPYSDGHRSAAVKLHWSRVLLHRVIMQLMQKEDGNTHRTVPGR
jgi:aerobic carbon-monoxide dehydrogenase medium subunit